MHEARISMTVNGRLVEKRCEPHLRLLDFVRDELHLTGNKEGCGAGECGTCSMFVDGKLIKSCLTPAAKAQGCKVDTVEGLADHESGELTVLQKAFHRTGASQCGFCIPGMVMAATSTLRRNPHASLDEIKEGLSGNICRCTGYQKIFEAVELARDVLNGSRPPAALDEEKVEGDFMGASYRRLDAPSKVAGRLQYAADMSLTNMLHMQVLRSPVPHGRIELLDVSEARAMPGVEAVITCDDVPGKDGFGVFYHDQPVLARGVVRHTGEQICAVVAGSPAIARAAIRKIKLRIAPLPGVFDPEEAIGPGAPQLHEAYPGNLCKHTRIRKGDVEQGFQQADYVFEDVFRTQAIEHAYLEPEAGVAWLDPDGTVVVHSPSQNITHHRHMLATILNRPINKVRMVMSAIGGGFGGKEDMIYQGMLALAAIKTRRPVKLVFTREESLAVSAKRHPFTIRYRMGVMKDGRIVASEMKMLADGGAYAMSSPAVMNKASILGPGPYRIPNVWVDAIAVYTNNTPSGAFRSFGAFQSEFATEAMLDQVAEHLKMDPIELRRVNAMRDGANTHTQQDIVRSVALLKCIDGAAEAAQWEPGVPHREALGQQRRDLGLAGARAPCELGARLPKHEARAAGPQVQQQQAQEVEQ
ncbi:aldehyde oxidoreductase [Massilia sp. WF1]|uniref:molybdopterin-dependent oxidoreductase n=1 Tax=unclassified Massilia TaxID=2609279 RepID=UPI000690DA74|nr:MULTISPECIES: molybdopterin cofactor-binding domain-containing protein [unclassified Massilia]ALK97634.1 aldehyde oxidoreductase [Massilia sp. WG5]KNZ67786.1 aldehyde oxidoreductase [Massilia sp. WF1]